MKGVTWIKAAAEAFPPRDERGRARATGRAIGYDYLVVCPGLQLDWAKVEGLAEALGRNGVCSNYDYETAEYTWECLENFRGGTALFTHPPTPIKCAGAPQKIMYLGGDHFRRAGIREGFRVVFASPAGRSSPCRVTPGAGGRSSTARGSRSTTGTTSRRSTARAKGGDLPVADRDGARRSPSPST